jgi:hypothetical protein
MSQRSSISASYLKPDQEVEEKPEISRGPRPQRRMAAGMALSRQPFCANYSQCSVPQSGMMDII